LGPENSSLRRSKLRERINRITDFNRSEGDQIVVEFGSYSVYESGPSVVVDFLNGSSVTLENTSLSSLTAGWIV
ncbi:MAG TPA: hypothetical protein PKA17_06835, partial [Phenylobacterium sp.]|nr:hypothetical protein [Phenylobacterium sp.]